MFENWKLEIVHIGSYAPRDTQKTEYVLKFKHTEFRTEIIGRGAHRDPNVAIEQAMKQLYINFHNHMEFAIPGSIPNPNGGVDWICAWDADIKAWYIETGQEKRYEKSNYSDSAPRSYQPHGAAF